MNAGNPKQGLRCLLALPTALLLLLGACALPQRPPAASLVIGNVTVIDPESRRVLARRDVHLRDGRVLGIHPAGSPVSPAARYVAADGKFLLPGFMDMHVHLAHPMFSENTLALLLANGVTGVREMSGDCWEPRGDIFACLDDYRALQADIESGRVRGPHIEQLSSAIVRGPVERRPPHVPDGAPDFVTPASADEGRRLARFLAQRGVDFIKTYSGLPRPAYFALAAQARAASLPVAGHVPLGVSVEEAAAAGHRSIEHAEIIPRDCSRQGETLRAASERRLRGEAGAPAPGTAERLDGIIASFDPARCRRLLETMARHGTYYVPTHETREMDARATEAGYRADPRLVHVPAMLRSFWEQDLQDTAEGTSPAEVDAYRRFHRHGLLITRLAFEAGVQVMVGTDANDTMSIPGFSLHDELGHFAQAGIPPMDVLRAATTLPAVYLGQSQALGGVATGKRADLVLLDHNPLDDIGHTRSIHAVVFNGQWLDRAALDALLESTRTPVARRAGSRP